MRSSSILGIAKPIRTCLLANQPLDTWSAVCVLLLKIVANGLSSASEPAAPGVATTPPKLVLTRRWPNFAKMSLNCSLSSFPLSEFSEQIVGGSHKEKKKRTKKYAGPTVSKGRKKKK
jgi:hypothetical protein